MTNPSDPGQRGKDAEAQASAWLMARSLSDAGFAFHRYPDARAAQGRLSAQPADYQVSQLGVGPFMLEVKETAEKTRLPKKKISQYGKLKLFSLAGTPARVVVHMTALDLWCYLADVDLFSYEVCPASFLLNGKKFATCNEVMSAIFGPIRNRS